MRAACFKDGFVGNNFCLGLGMTSYKMLSVFVGKSTFCLWAGRIFSKDLQTIPFKNEVDKIF